MKLEEFFLSEACLKTVEGFQCPDYLTLFNISETQDPTNFLRFGFVQKLRVGTWKGARKIFFVKHSAEHKIAASIELGATSSPIASKYARPSYRTLHDTKYFQISRKGETTTRSIMASRKQKSRKAAKAAETKTSRAQGNTRKMEAAKVSKLSNTTASSSLRRSARVAARSAAQGTSKHGRTSKDDSRFVQILRTEKELPETLATIQRISRIKLLENFTDLIDRLNLVPGLSYVEKKALVQKLKPLPQRQRNKIYDEVSQAGVDKVLANTFGYRYDSAKDSEKHVWFWYQALGSWRDWVISGTGRVHETFHLTPPSAVALAWEMQLKLCSHPGLHLRTQPAFHLAEDDSVKVVGMPFTIITDHETWLSTEYLKTQHVDEAVSKRFRIPVECIVDPCLVIKYSQAVPRLVSDLPLYDPFTPLGFMWYPEDDDEDEDGNEEEPDNAPLGMACWDWVFLC
jgi:hypothetical protein